LGVDGKWSTDRFSMMGLALGIRGNELWFIGCWDSLVYAPSFGIIPVTFVVCVIRSYSCIALTEATKDLSVW